MAKYFKEKSKAWGTTNYHATGEDPYPGQDPKFADVHVYPTARLDMKNSREVPIVGTHPRNESEEIDAVETIERVMKNSSPEDIERAIERQSDTPQMFMHKPAEITGLYADPRMKHTVGTLLGMALSQEGPGVVVADDLSKYSSRLARRGIAAGVVEGHPVNPDADVTNSVAMRQYGTQFENGLPLKAYYSTDSEMAPVSKGEVDSGRKFIHQALRGERHPRNLSPQFQALQKFEEQNARNEPYNPAKDPNAMQIPGLESQ